MRRVLKRGLAVFLTAVLLLSVPGGPVAAAAAVESGSGAIREAAGAVSRGVSALTDGTSDTLETLGAEGTVYMSPDGTWQIGFRKTDGSLWSFHAEDGFSGKVVIPEEIEGVAVRSIGVNTFYNCTPLTSIILPDTLTSIQMSAFDGCTNLASVTLGSGLRTIRSYAFADCSGLTNLELPDTVTQIEAGAFLQCTSLTSITLPGSLTSLGSGAFSRCDKLTSADLSASQLTCIETNAFDRCGNLASVTLPTGLTGIGDSAFSGCSALTSITLPASLTSIGDNAFSGCSALTGLTLPDNLTSIGAYAFSGCAITELTLPAGLTTLGEGAFSECESLTCADLSASQLTGIETYTFSGCHGLKSVTLPANLTGIGAYAFSGCSALTSITLPANLTSIGAYAFSGCAITELTLPSGLTNLGEGAFSGCGNLTSMALPNGVTTLGEDAFSDCSSLISVTLPSGLTDIGTSAFKNCVQLTGITLPGSLTSIGDTAFYGCSALTSIRLPASLSSIGDSAFGGCSALCYAYVFSDDLVFSYDVFPVNEGFLLYCHADSTAEQYAKTNGLQYVLIEGGVERVLRVTVIKPDGTALTEGYTVSWYLGTGSSPVGTGTTLANAIVGQDYEVQVELSDELAALYEQPGRLAMEADTMEICLQEREAAEKVSLHGTVTALDGTPLPDVQVTASGVNFSGRSGQSAEDGTFTLEVPTGQMEVTLSKTGYYSRRFTLDLSDRNDGAVEELGTLLLVETEASHIDLRLTLQYAAGDGETPLQRSLTTAEGYTVTLSHADGSSIRGAELQGLTLVFPPQSVTASETLTLTLESRDGTTAPARVSVQLDENCVGAAEITLCQRGSITCGAIAPAGADLLLFDADGQLVQLCAGVSSFQSEPLAAGSYTVVLIQSSPLLRGISSLEMLDHLGLEAADYVKRSVEVTDGHISDLGEITVPQPDEGAITVTDSSATYLSSNRSQVALGGLFLVEAGFRLREGYSELPSSLQFYLPQGIQVVAGSVTLDGAVSRYEVQDDVLSIPLAGRSSATVRMYCQALLDGTGVISASLAFAGDAVQPLGSVSVQGCLLELQAPTETTSNQITVWGKALANTEVKIYDNGVQVGTATANAVGSWGAIILLADPLYQGSYHVISAEVTAFDGSKLVSPRCPVIYRDDVPVLSKVTMYVSGSSTELYFSGSEAAGTVLPSYLVIGGPDEEIPITYQVEFENKAVQAEQVYVVTKTASGMERRIEMSYDPESGTWVGSGNYRQSDSAMPTSLCVEYSGIKAEPVYLEPQRVENAVEQMEEQSEQAAAILEANGYGTRIRENTQTDVSMDLVYAPDGGQETVWGTYTVSVSHTDETAQSLTEAGYYTIQDGNNVYYTKTVYGDDHTITTRIIDPSDGTCVTEIYDFQPASGTGQRTLRSNVMPLEEDGLGDMILEELIDQTKELLTGWVPAAGLTADLIELAGEQYVWRSTVEGNVWAMECMLDTLDLVAEARCQEDGMRRLPDEIYSGVKAQLRSLRSEVIGYEATSLDLINQALLVKGIQELCSQGFDRITAAGSRARQLLETKYHVDLERISEAAELAGDTAENAEAMIEFIDEVTGGQVHLDALGVTAFSLSGIENYIDSGYADLYQRIDQLNNLIRTSMRDCDEDDPPEKDKQTSPEKALSPLIDPSGYVYEAVPSNRLEGVTATVYYQDENSVEIQWDAGNYDQINPQNTGSDGGYAWFVPEGQWKVTFTKEGYENADSTGVPAATGNTENEGWLPVPPPQFEVNVGMVSTAAPTVEGVTAYTDRIEVVFSQYMDIESVQSAVTLTQDGTNVPVTVEALDAEYDLAGTTQYATRFAVTPADGDCTGTLTVSAGAKNYANKTLANAYTMPLTAPVQRPTAITAGDCSLVVHEAGALMVTLVNGAAGTALTVESLTPGLLTVSGEIVTTGADGTAALTLTGNLPGVGQIRVTEPVSGLSETFHVSITMTEKDVPGEVKPEPVIATLSDGTVVTTGMTVGKGTKITLSTTTEGAAIRYTLNDTCPCKDEALTYTGPIAITANTTLRAAAVLDGVYSDTIRLELMIKAEQSGGGTGGGVSNSVNYAVETADTEHGTITVTPSRAKTGDTVTIAVKPDAGYVLRTLTVADGKGNDVKLIDVDSRTYRFTMPDSAVLVNAVFAQELEMLIAFTDVDAEDYFYDAVAWAVAHNVTFGTSDTTFSPDNVCTRAQAVTFLWRAAGSPQPQMIINPFEDVQESDYFYNAVLWSVENNITAGTSAGTFSPDTVCTRSQAVTFLYRYDGTVATEMTEFIDVNETAYYYDAVQWAAQNGITSGTGTNTFSPEANCTRAQIVTFLYRALKK